MKRIDDLQVGEWVVFTAVTNETPELVTEGMAGMVVAPACDRYEVDGRGYQIRAISLPFALLWCPVYQSLRSVDLRRVTLAGLTKQFVDVLLCAQARSGSLHLPGPIPTPKGINDDEEVEAPKAPTTRPAQAEPIVGSSIGFGKMFGWAAVDPAKEGGDYTVQGTLKPNADSIEFAKSKKKASKNKPLPMMMCPNCGTPMDKTGTGYHCPRCGINPQLVQG